MNAGPHLRSRGEAQAGRTATAVRPAHQGGHANPRWLMLAAETAGLIRGNGRASPDACPAGRGDLPRVATCTPGTDAGSVHAARDFTLATLHRWDAAERGEDIAIVVTELLTNALRHALPWPGDPSPPSPIRLGLLQPGSCVLCAVADPGRAVPVPQGPGSLAETGRGLQIIRALSDMWGYTVLGDAGKVVWAAFTLRPMPPPGPRPG
jgi:anti-sigma regulatory factor (Ser/Thr protein kinase)